MGRNSEKREGETERRLGRKERNMEICLPTWQNEIDADIKKYKRTNAELYFC